MHGMKLEIYLELHKQELEKYLSHLPKDRKKQLMREIKLKHILKDV